MSSGGEIGKECQYLSVWLLRWCRCVCLCSSLYLDTHFTGVYHSVMLCHPQILSVMDAVLWLQLPHFLTPPFLHLSPDLSASRIDARLDL